ncbi:DUF4871 domain-containing protein [Brevibacillus daliensis]|uniref:DUF4871 domain-containing protein n=1 Tax=Brevibacillus daliensis TaxID=2892995 RepID=UPI001E31D1AE|nr:DUF4871 domain-containing protein [Brevibacillus daliensis]
MKQVLMLTIIASLLLSGCLTSENASAPPNYSTPEALPVFGPKLPSPSLQTDEITPSPAEDYPWELSQVFTSGTYQMRGVPGKIAIMDTPFFFSGRSNKMMWHVWGDRDHLLGAKLKVVAIHKETGEQFPALDRVDSNNSRSKIWEIELGGPLADADAHSPSLISLPYAGLWRLDTYLDNKYYASIVVEVKDAWNEGKVSENASELSPEQVMWKVSNTFVYGSDKLHGTEGRMGFHFWYPLQASMGYHRFTLFLWTKPFQNKQSKIKIVAVPEKGSSSTNPVTIRFDDDFEHLGFPINVYAKPGYSVGSISFPDKGLWRLDVYVNDVYFDSAVVSL